MPSKYTAKAGDSLCSIAYQNGFADCKPLRADAANAYILNRKVDPCQVQPNDIVTIPEKTEKEVDGATDKRHDFVKRGRLAFVRFVHGSSNADPTVDPSLFRLNVSNYEANRGGNPDGTAAFPGTGVKNFNANGHNDVDTFKVEVFDIRGSGELDAEIEALKPVYNAAGSVTKHEPFPTPRKLAVKLGLQAGSKRFRSCYLRLVTDATDRAAITKQALLVSDLYDAGDKKVEILDQLVRASYTIPSCPEGTKCRSIVHAQIGTDRRRLRLNVHVLRRSVGGAPIVSTADAERRILVWLRRIYAQMSIAPKLVSAVREVDPPMNLVSISNDTGSRAQGNGRLKFRIRAAGETDQVIRHRPDPTDSPLKSAMALAAKINMPFKAVVTSNPARFDHSPGRKSADILITEASGKRVIIDLEHSTDSGQSVTVGRPNPMLFQEWNGNNWLVGSIEQRTILKNYGGGDNRFDLFVINRFVSPTLLGAAMMSGHQVDPARSAIPSVKWSAFVDLRSSAAGDGYPAVIAHEAMHAVGEVMHAQAAPKQLMHPFADAADAVTIAKRVRDGAVTYDGGNIAGDHNLVSRMRSQGSSLLESW
ncbi:MAG: hypothetical protein KIS76_08025 [Pyrinomonadaceae bacterium]|nr:hypothetical protein [Pyrinomonadaceae bacterium]